MNETVLIVTGLLDLLIVLTAFRLGREWLYATIVVNLLLISLFGAKLIDVFGVATNSGNIFYASAFFATYLLIEHGSTKDGMRAVWIGASAIICFLGLSQLALMATSVQETARVSETMNQILAIAPRIALASVVAYVIAQYVNIVAYDSWKERVGNPHWWMRAVCVMMGAQLVDSVIFFTVGFVGTVGGGIVLESMLAGYVIKVIVGLAAIPLLYMSHYTKHEGQPAFSR